MADPADPGVDAAAAAAKDPDERPLGLVLWVSIVLAAAGLVWGTGFVLLRAAGQPTRIWDLSWGLAGISFLFAFVPLPGFTSALLFALARSGYAFGLVGVVGAAVGGTAAAGLLLALGHTGREHLRKRATRSPRARKVLAWSHRAAKKWTYAGLFVFLIPQFIPRAVVLYAAVLAKLRTVPFLAVVLAGTFTRNLLMLVAFKAGWSLFT